MRNKKARIKPNKILVIVFIFSFLMAIIKLSYVAISPNVDGKNLTDFANKRNTVKKTLYASRGNIYDKNGNILAKNVNSYNLIAYLSDTRTENPKKPRHVVDKEKTASLLAGPTGLNEKYILDMLNYKGYQIEFHLSLSENEKKEIEALNLPGIGFTSSTKRYYRMSNAASYVIGYAKANDKGEIIGEMGIEGYYNDLLKGTDGETEYRVDAYGYQMGDAYTKESVSGSDIYLTLDSQIQLIVEEAVRKMEDNYNYKWLTINVMDAKTGAIVGTSASPGFNPNTFEGLKSYVNPLVGYTYEPGSTMKIFTWLKAMEDNKYDGDETYLSGRTKVDGYIIQDWNHKGWGTITYDVGFAYSSNVAATNLANRIGSKDLQEFYKSLGFGSKTGISLPGEETGIISVREGIGLANASFGQGITTTPIQTLQALSILANDGVMIKPYIVDKIINENGEITFQGGREELGKKISTESVEKMKELMYDVVYMHKSMWVTNNVTFIGKTGTAEIAENGVYLSGDYDNIRSFAGLFPMEDPKYIVYASVQQLVADSHQPLADALTKAVESIANYANVTDTSSNINKEEIIELNNYVSSNIIETKENLEKLNLKVIVIGNGEHVINQYPLKKAKVLKNTKIFLLSDSIEYVMPDMKGWSTSDVMNFCSLINLKFNFSGYGKVVDINMLPGSIIDLSKTLEINLGE